jgi:hypothetical protein
VPLEEVVLHALEKSPGDRPADAGAFRRELYATAERLGLEHASGHSAPTIESLRGAGPETPSGRLIVDMVRVREHRASITSGEALRSADIAKEISEPTTPPPPAPERAADTESNASPATAALLIPRGPSFSKLRIVFERPEVWLRWLRNPVALTCISLAVLMLVVVAFAIVATRSSGKSNTSANNSTEAGNSAPAGDKQLSAVPSPGADPSPGSVDPPAVNNRAQQSPRNNAPRRRPVNTAQRRQPPPQKGGGFWNKLKRKMNPF